MEFHVQHQYSLRGWRIVTGTVFSSVLPVDSSINGSNTFVAVRKNYDNRRLPAR
jgi:hypothetical protein